MIDLDARLGKWWFPAAILVAILLRLALLPLWTVDQRDFLIPWLQYARANGVDYLDRPFTNYAPFYEHVLALLAQLPGPEMVRIKLTSILFDVVLAGLIAALAPPGQKRLGFALFLLMPTAILNSSAWGQCDAIYASFTMLALLFAMRGRPVATSMAFGVAIAVKLQAAIFAPVLLLLTLERRQPLWTYLLVPLPYLAIALPMLAAGRPLHDTLFVYGNQFSTFDKLAQVSPNPWIVLNKLVDYQTGMLIGVPVAAAIVGGAVWWLHRHRVARTGEGLLVAAALFAVLVPFVTPKMHERFFYLVDPMVILLVCRDWRYFRVLLLAEGASLISYIPFMLVSTDPEGPIVRSYVWLQKNYGGGYGVLAVPGAILMGMALYLLVKRAREFGGEPRRGRSSGMATAAALR